MTLATITAAISTVGFPIICVIGLAWYVNKQSAFTNELYKDLKFCIDNNTSVITEMKETLVGLREDVDDLQNKMK